MLGEINVTPLVDVVLVLLLVFMVTAPMMSRGIDVSLPVANQPQIPQEDRVTVSIRADGRVFVGGPARERGPPRGPPARPDLGAPRQVVYLRADEGLRYGKVIEVVDLHQARGRRAASASCTCCPEEKRR